jgi:hypothetical protein
VPTFPHGEGGPGGIALADLSLWFRSDFQVTTVDDGAGGFDVTEWKDATATAVTAIPSDAAPAPKLVQTGPKNAPALRFDGTSAFVIPHNVNFFGFAVFVGFQTTSTDGSSSTDWQLTPPIVTTGLTCGKDFTIGVNSGKGRFVLDDTTRTAVIESDSNVNDGIPHSLLIERGISGNRHRVFVDGVQEQNPRSNINATIDCSDHLMLGTTDSMKVFWTGDLFEVVARTGGFSGVQTKLVTHYLAGRMGGPVPDSLYDFFATHSGDIAGIGRQDDANGNIDRIGTAEGTGMVQFSDATALGSGDFLLWGTDLPEDFTFSNNVTAPFSSRLKRTWAYTMTDGGDGDGVGKVNVRFRVEGLPITANVEDFAFLIDSDTDFSDASFHVTGATYASDPAMISFTDVLLPPGGGYFTLACKEE